MTGVTPRAKQRGSGCRRQRLGAEWRSSTTSSARTATAARHGATLRVRLWAGRLRAFLVGRRAGRGAGGAGSGAGAVFPAVRSEGFRDGGLWPGLERGRAAVDRRRDGRREEGGKCRAGL